MVRGHPSPRFLPLDALDAFGARSRRLRNEVVIAPRDNGFPGSAVALDGPSRWSVSLAELLVDSRFSSCRLPYSFRAYFIANVGHTAFIGHA